jgi:hypothetical protein
MVHVHRLEEFVHGREAEGAVTCALSQVPLTGGDELAHLASAEGISVTLRECVIAGHI